jgi:peroxiredoxin
VTIRGIRTRPSRPARLVAVALAGLLLLAAGCGVGGRTSADAGSPAAPPAGAAPLAFEAATTDGGTLSGRTLAGRPAVFWFWAPWCTICRGEAPRIARAHERFGERVQFVGVAGLGRVAAMREFVADTGLGAFPHLVDDDGSLWASFGVPEQPAFAFVAADGGFDVWLGRLTENALAGRLDELSRT